MVILACCGQRGLDLPPHGLIAFVPMHDIPIVMRPTKFAMGTHWTKLNNYAGTQRDWPVVDTPMKLGSAVV
jgi:hypothetical protein